MNIREVGYFFMVCVVEFLGVSRLFAGLCLYWFIAVLGSVVFLSVAV